MRATIYNASAGSGKTYRLAYKYVRDVIENPPLYRNILAVTFTNKATEEMKSRILSEIHMLASGAKSNYLDDLVSELSLTEEQIRQIAMQVRSRILHDYSRFTVLTIDTFFQRIIRAFIQELGLDINYNIELESSSVLTKSADKLIEQITIDEELKRWILEFVEERISDGNRWDIREGILSLGDEIFKESNREILDGDDSKARLKQILRNADAQIKTLSREFQQIGTEAMEIIVTAGSSPTDFKGGSRSFATYFQVAASGELKAPTPTVIANCESTDNWYGKKSLACDLSSELQPLLQQLCDKYSQTSRVINAAALIRENFRSFALLSDLYREVQQACAEQNMMLLSETKVILTEFIANNDTPFIYEKVGNRFERYMIDEFQDTSLKEWYNFLPLLHNAMAQSEQSSVLIVGDIKQAIYRWRGGDWRILHSLAREELGAESTEIVNMQENYRSLPQIVEFNNYAIEAVVKLDNMSLNNKITTALNSDALDAETYCELNDMLLNAYTDHAQIPRKSASCSGYVEVTPYSGEQEPPIVERVIEILDQGFSPSEILILTRSKSEGVRVADQLLQFKSVNKVEKYNFDVMTQEALIVGFAPVSNFVIAAMSLALDEESGVQRVIYNRFLGDRDLDAPLSDEDRLFLQKIRILSPEEAFEQIVIYYSLSSVSQNIAYLQAIHEQIIGFSSSKIGDITLFLKWWEESGHNKSLSVEQSDSSIEITTIHKAKGLEKAVVILPFCNWKLDPKTNNGTIKNIVWAEAQGELEGLGLFPIKFKKAMGESLFSNQYFRELVQSHVDSVNLLYVALTRASQALHIFVPLKLDSKGNEKEHIGKILLDAMGCRSEIPKQGALACKVIERNSGLSYTYGDTPQPLKRDRAESSQLVCMDDYPTSIADLRLRLPSQRYFEQDPEAELTPRHLGILMHKAFEESSSADDVFRRIELMRTNAHINQTEYEIIIEKMHESLRNPLIEEWFDGSWDEIRNEHEIIIPKESSFRRPDRVMFKGDRVVVVDYKFGRNELPEHQKQVADYMNLISAMGYTHVEGYLWYIKSGNIKSV